MGQFDVWWLPETVSAIVESNLRHLIACRSERERKVCVDRCGGHLGSKSRICGGARGIRKANDERDLALALYGERNGRTLTKFGSFTGCRPGLVRHAK